jgi:hypothetical protein
MCKFKPSRREEREMYLRIDTMDSDNESLLSEVNGTVYTDSEDEMDLETNADYIFYQDEVFLDSPKIHNKYYIGISKYIYSQDYYLLLCAMSPQTFYRVDYYTALSYLTEYSIVPIHNSNIDILQLIIHDDHVYTVIKKTHWLRLIQRTWKKIYRLKREITRKRCSISAIQYREIHGKYPRELQSVPTIYGMLTSFGG